MRALFLLAGLCLLTAPTAAAQEVGPEIWLSDPEDEVDKVLDLTVMLDPHLGDDGSCLREGAVHEAKELYGDHDATGQHAVLECLAAQCVGWPPEPFVSTENCKRMLEDAIKDLLGISVYATDT